MKSKYGTELVNKKEMNNFCGYTTIWYLYHWSQRDKYKNNIQE